MYKGGYIGKIAWVDLTTREARIQPTDPELVNMYMGGAGFGIKLLYDHVQPGITGTPATKRAQPLVSRPAGDQGEDQENQTEECKCTTGNHQKDLPNYDADYQ